MTDRHEADDASTLAPRVEVVERQIGDIRSQIGNLQSHVDRGFDKVSSLVSDLQNRMAGDLKDRDARMERVFSQINGKFDEQSRSSHTDWKAVISAVALGVVIIGAVGSAYVLPLARADQTHETLLAEHLRSINDLRDREAEQRALLARLDERSKFAVYVGGTKPTKESP